MGGALIFGSEPSIDDADHQLVYAPVRGRGRSLVRVGVRRPRLSVSATGRTRLVDLLLPRLMDQSAGLQPVPVLFPPWRTVSGRSSDRLGRDLPALWVDRWAVFRRRLLSLPVGRLPLCDDRHTLRRRPGSVFRRSRRSRGVSRNPGRHQPSRIADHLRSGDASRFPARLLVAPGQRRGLAVDRDRRRSCDHRVAVALGTGGERHALRVVSAGRQGNRLYGAPGRRRRLPAAGGHCAGSGTSLAGRRGLLGDGRGSQDLRAGVGAVGAGRREREALGLVRRDADGVVCTVRPARRHGLRITARLCANVGVQLGGIRAAHDRLAAVRGQIRLGRAVRRLLGRLRFPIFPERDT